MTSETPQWIIKSGFHYLATPYSADVAWKRQLRFREAMVFSWLLHRRTIHHFCPIVQCHQISQDLGMPTDAEFWWNFNRLFMEPSVGMLIAAMEGWEKSVGIRREREFFETQHKPVILVHREPITNELFFEHLSPSIPLQGAQPDEPSCMASASVDRPQPRAQRNKRD